MIIPKIIIQRVAARRAITPKAANAITAKPRVGNAINHQQRVNHRRQRVSRHPRRVIQPLVINKHHGAGAACAYVLVTLTKDGRGGPSLAAAFLFNRGFV